MKGFKEFIGESVTGSSRPVLDEILEAMSQQDRLLAKMYFKNKLGADFLEFEVSSKNGERIQQEFSPRGFIKHVRYNSSIDRIGGFQFYFYKHDGEVKAIRSVDSSTWWIRLSEFKKIEDKWFIDDMLEDF